MLSSVKHRLANISNTQKNVLLFTLEGAVAAIILNLANPFFSMFAKRMGAGDYQIGLVNSLPALIGIIALVPGAMLVDTRGDKRKTVCFLIFLTGIFYPLAALTPFMGDLRVPLYILFISLLNWPYSVFTISWQSFFSDAFIHGNTNLAYTNRSKASNFFGSITALLAGLILAYIPHSDSQRIIVYQVFFALSFGLALVQSWLLSRVKAYSAPVDRAKGQSIRTLIDCMKKLKSNSPFTAFIIVAFIFHITWQMAWPLFFLYQVDYLYANEAWLSYISLANLLAGVLTYSFWGRVVEKKGSRFVIVIGAFGLAVNPLMLILCKTLFMALVANTITGLTFSAFQLALFENLMEVVPQENKTLNIAIYTTFVNISGFIAPLLGVWVYKNSNIYIAMTAAFVLRTAAAGLFYFRYRKSSVSMSPKQSGTQNTPDRSA